MVEMDVTYELWSLRDEVERQRDYARIQRERIEELEAFLARLGWNADFTPTVPDSPDRLVWRARFVDEG